MVSINPYAATSWGGTSSLAGVTATKAIEDSGKIAATGESETSSSVSNLARQLSEAAARAAVRDASMTMPQLAMEEKIRRDEFCGDAYQARKASANAEAPDTDDPELLARAKQATEFVNSRGQNPFAGLSRDQLSLIMYDKGDAFTVNERRAAWLEHFRQRSQWSQQVCAQGWAEKQSTGTFTNFFKAVIAEYQAAPLIEQATYPENYAALRQRWIDYWEAGNGSGDMAKDFFEVMLRPLPTPKHYDESLSWGTGSRLSTAGLDTSFGA